LGPYAGEATVHFAQKVDILDPATDRPLASGVTEWPAPGNPLETSLVYYRPAR
jgi:hypothetical protein